MKMIRPLVVGAVIVAALWALFAHGNPGGIPDAKYSEFKQLGPPKLLYSCTRKPTRASFSGQLSDCVQSGRAGCDEKVDEWVEAGTETSVDYVAGPKASSYDQLLHDARANCAANGANTESAEFKVLEADKN